MAKVKVVKTTARTLCLQVDPRHYAHREPSYEFSSKRFTKPQQTNMVKENE
jgi:hypothetical protein